MDTVPATVQRYRGGSPNSTKRVRTEITDSSCATLFELLQNGRKLSEKQHCTIELPVKTYLKTVDSFHGSSELECSRPW